MAEPNSFQIALLIILVIMVFNVIIFVHELGHFWAAKWRGLKIDRFQIWFGKPIWSKEINGVQYGLGWLPAGGFVALPQMAPMEAIEGTNREGGEALKPISPLDKIIVAFAGPLFSFLLAFVAAIILWQIGKPADTLETTTIGWVEAGSAAAEAGLQRGDRILAINDEPVDSWAGTLDGVAFKIPTSRGDNIRFTIDRPDAGRMDIVSRYTIPESDWWERKKTRQVGILPMVDGPVKVGLIRGENAPAEAAGLMTDDLVIAVNGTPAIHSQQILEFLAQNGPEPVTFTIERTENGAPLRKDIVITPLKPAIAPEADLQRYMIGASFYNDSVFVEKWQHPTPLQQMKDTVSQMWITITSVIAKDSSIGIQHLSGPIGIGKIQFYSMLMDYPLHRILGFMVLININLAILNMLPLPVLDGGHITFAIMEAITRRPVRARILEVLQLGFVFLLLSVMLYVSSKDLFDDFGMGTPKPKVIVFPERG